jgi:hypothetical protein
MLPSITTNHNNQRRRRPTSGNSRTGSTESDDQVPNVGRRGAGAVRLFPGGQITELQAGGPHQPVREGQSRGRLEVGREPGVEGDAAGEADLAGVVEVEPQARPDQRDR